MPAYFRVENYGLLFPALSSFGEEREKNGAANSPRNFFWTNIFAGSKVKTVKQDGLQKRPSIIWLGRTMKFAPIQYLFARNWPAKIFFAAVAMLGLWFGIGISMSFSTETGSWLDFILLRIIPVVVSPVLAFFLSLPSAWIVLGPLYYFCSKLNGAPFHTGDRVRILVGPYRDRVGRIYAVWDERRQVRVDLGLEMKDVKDVFAFTQVCRESASP